MPSPARAAQSPEGFCGRAASLEPEYLIDAYARGLTLRNFLGAATLWAPRVRAVLRPWDFPRGIAESGAEGERVSLDEAFDVVLSACGGAEPAHWRKPALDMALGDLYDAGFAHSLEVRDRNGVLVAGLIGVAAGGVFTIERMFALDQDSLVHAVNNLAFQLQRWNFALIDIRSPSDLATRLQCATISSRAILRRTGEQRVRRTPRTLAHRRRPAAAGAPHWRIIAENRRASLSRATPEKVRSGAEKDGGIKAVGVMPGRAEAQARAMRRLASRQRVQSRAFQAFLSRFGGKIRMGGEKARHAVLIFLAQQRAGDIDQPPARLHEGGGAGEDFVLRLDPLLERARTHAPFGVGIAPPRADSRAGRVN